ncbi:MAG: hypothetical protein PHW72_00715 [Candidatus Pacebacteria bacterium]|nr:hypothetical protein [Candidatus Paceibacterota bacterium]
MQTSKGFSFIDVLVGISLMLIVFLGIFGAYQLGLRVILQSKNRITATAIANQKIEIIRNLPYRDIGTTPHSIDEPEGNISQTETTIRNNVEYSIETRIAYVNDCFDGPQNSECPTAPSSDSCPRDYKRATVGVSWRNPKPGSVSLTTDISPKSLNQEEEECTGEAAGVLSVTVFNALGQAVDSPLIEIIDPDSEMVLSFSQPISGNHDFVFPSGTYKVKVSKNNYNTSQTYGAGDVYQGQIIAEPLKSHPSVYEGDLTEIGFSIDQVGSFMIETRGTADQGYPPIHDVLFRMTGSQTVGNKEDGSPIYKYSGDHLTNGTADITISGLEWDSYNFFVDSSSYELIGFESPLGSTTTQPVTLLPDENKELRLILKAENTLNATVRDASSSQPVFGAGVRLYQTGLGYDEIQPTNASGTTLFLPLQAEIYNFEIEALGYASSSGSVSVLGDDDLNINLNPLP